VAFSISSASSPSRCLYNAFLASSPPAKALATSFASSLSYLLNLFETPAAYLAFSLSNKILANVFISYYPDS